MGVAKNGAISAQSIRLRSGSAGHQRLANEEEENHAIQVI